MIFLLLAAVSVAQPYEKLSHRSGALTGIVYIIRHAESSLQEARSLKCEENPAFFQERSGLSVVGQERAYYLPSIFNGTKFQRPTALFAGALVDRLCEPQRTFHPLKPLAKALGLNVTTAYSSHETKEAAHAIYESFGQGKVVLVAWERSEVLPLCEALGANGGWGKCPPWMESDYDSVYQLKIRGGVRWPEFQHRYENFTSSFLA